MNDLYEHPEGTSLGEIEIDRFLTVPNVITTVRLFCIPLFLIVLFGHDSPGWAGVILGALGATDWVDGFVARRFNQTSVIGKMYDPTVDRLMLVVALVAVIIHGSVPLWFAVTIGVREVVVSSYVVIITSMGAKRMNVTWWGKVGAFANMCAVPFFLFAAETSLSDPWRTFWRVLAYVAAVPGVVFGLWSGLQYFALGREALAAGRAERSMV